MVRDCSDSPADRESVDEDHEVHHHHSTTEDADLVSLSDHSTTGDGVQILSP